MRPKVARRDFEAAQHPRTMRRFSGSGDFGYLDTRSDRINLIKQLAAKISAGLSSVHPSFIAERAGGCLAVKDGSFLSLQVVRSRQHSQKHSRPEPCGVASGRPGVAVVARLDD